MLSTDRYMSRFLLVSLNIDAILQEPTIHRRRQKLNAMTNGLGLGDAYGATLGRIKDQGGEKARLGIAALMWVSHAERPLKPDELCNALAVEIWSPNLNRDNVPSIGTLLGCCQGLIVIGKETSTVRLIHFTLQEYLRAHPQLFRTAHSIMAETCLSYLNSPQVKAFSTTPSPDLQSTPFLDYSSLYWGIHAKRDLSHGAKLLALKLFDDYNSHISIKILLNAQGCYSPELDPGKTSQFSGLHCASLLGINKIVAGLVEAEGCHINQKDCFGYAPLHWAAREGREGVVKILLARDDIDSDIRGVGGRTPLGCAASHGHEGVVKILLERNDVNPQSRAIFGETPLYLAAKEGHEGVVKILLGRREVDPNTLGFMGRTPLCEAVNRGFRGVVEILLERDDVNPNKRDNIGDTPLSRAIFQRQADLVALLQPLASTTPSTTPFTLSNYRYNSPHTTSPRTTPAAQTRPPRSLPLSPHSRTVSSRISKRGPRYFPRE